MMTDTALFANDGVLHIIGLSFPKFFLITVIVLLSLCSFGIQVIKFNGNSIVVIVAKSEREVTVTMRDMLTAGLILPPSVHDICLLEYSH